MSILTRDVLVLNKHWVAVNVVNVKRAIKLVYKGDANIVDHQFRTYTWQEWERIVPEDDYVVGATRLYRIPNVILLRSYGKVAKSQRVNFSRKAVFKRDGYQCMYCGIKPSPSLLNLDHILPQSQGGSTCFENTVTSCISCNSKKGSRTPAQANMRLIREPFRPKFDIFGGQYSKLWENFI